MTSPADHRSAFLRLAALLLVVALASLAVAEVAPFLLDPRAVRTRVAGFGPFAPLAFLAVQTTQVVAAPVPGQLLAVAGGYLFGPLAGAAYSVLGVLLGSAVAIGLTRRYGRPYVESVVDGRTLARFDDVVARTGEAGLFLAFLLPVFPDDALCFVAGLTDIPVRRLLLLVVVGRAPTFVVAAYLGEAVVSADLVAVALLLLAGAVLTAVGYRKREALATGTGTEEDPEATTEG